MIILDTNVISEPLRQQANPAVAAWLDRQPVESLYMTAINLAELLTGIELLPTGKRKTDISDGLTKIIESVFAGRILGFEEKAAQAYASLISKAHAQGYTISVADGQIAAIAKVHGFSVASRDTTPFEAAGVKVINPWLA